MRYMMIIGAMLALFVAACAGPAADMPANTTDNTTAGTLCPEVRPEACTREYMPVCGDNGQTYGNGCEACSDQGVNSYEQGTCAGPTLTVLYAGAFTTPEQAQTVYTLNGNVLTKETMTNDNESTSLVTKELSAEEIGELQDALAQVSTLESSYTSDTMVTDVGYAVITVNGQQTTIDPNIDESYPEQLMPLREWINGQAEWFYAQENPQGERLAFTECAEPRPEACTMQYDPVCGSVDTGIRCITEPCPSQEYKTYGNSCAACSNQDVLGYFPGACEDMNNQANV